MGANVNGIYLTEMNVTKFKFNDDAVEFVSTANRDSIWTEKVKTRVYSFKEPTVEWMRCSNTIPSNQPLQSKRLTAESRFDAHRDKTDRKINRDFAI